MIVCTSPAEMHSACRNLRDTLRRADDLLGLVPTMGALHAGHLSLVARARAECHAVAASIFVNPTQFAPGEDFASYPRSFDQDCHKLESAGVDILFAPSPEAMYPPGNTTLVDPGPIAARLDGASRPGHFQGVATIVVRLLHIVEPDRAYFGQKDAAQVAVLRHIVSDLNLDTAITVCPIVREPDGLALSSRNRYLSPAERTRALVLSRALTAARLLALPNHAAHRATTAESLLTAMLAIFADHGSASRTDFDSGTVPFRLDYAAVVDPDTLLPIADTTHGALVAVAAWIGATRLIDNLLLPPRA